MTGARVTLVTVGSVGGRAGWSSLVPSKAWLVTADTLGSLHHVFPLGLRGIDDATVDPATVLSRIRSLVKERSRQQVEALDLMGVQQVSGLGVFVSPTEVSVQDSSGSEVARLQADAVIVAAGSVPTFPQGIWPDGERILAPRFADKICALPEDILVVGSGYTGSEFAYLFNRLGVRVTWIAGSRGVLPEFPAEAGRHLAQALTCRGGHPGVRPPAAGNRACR